MTGEMRVRIDLEEARDAAAMREIAKATGASPAKLQSLHVPRRRIEELELRARMITASEAYA